MNQKNGNGLNSIKKIISKCCNTDNFDISEQKNDKDVLIFKICSNEVLNIDLDKLCAQDFYICFEKCTIKILRLSEKKIKINLNLFFNSCSFEEIEIYNVYFLGQFKISELVDTLEKIKDIKFNHCAFNNLILEKNKFENNICFEEKTKIKKIYLYENEFKKHFFIKKCFIGSINLWKNEFKNRCYFMDSKFGYDEDENKKAKLNFSNARFQDNVYFNNSHFYDYVDFHECEFEKITCFYGVKFHKIPNFSACYFKEQKAVNLINVDIDKLDFKSVEKYIEDNYQDETCENKQEITEEQRNNNCKLKCAKHLKDSFRVIKDVLITQNNTLEAQEWHKLELYAKEKENHINLSVKDREKNADIFKNILIWFNCVLLNVYRNTSDHHNDFLKILNFTVGMIVLYGVFIFFCQACIEPYSKFFNELKSSVIFIIIGILVFLCCIMFYFNRKKSIFAKSIFFIIAMVFIVLYLVTYFYKTNEYKTILYLVMCYILSIYICYFFFNIKNIIFNIVFKFMLYLVFLFFLINSSQLINPFTGVFSSGKLYESQFEKSLNDLNASAIVNLASILQNDFNLHLKDQNISFTELNSAKALIVANKENLLKLNDVNSNITKEVLGEKYTELLKIINQDKITENTIKSTSVLYSIILLLCIFSLQKTARKNSIVPS
ncbi:hypothetical protein CYA42_07995 [Campylobacter coli]|nr:hypothetical protein [Campylobacter coli]